MARRLSRRALAQHLAEAVIDGNTATALKQVAAYLIENRRTKEAELIVRDAEYLLARQGRVTATVTTAFDLSEQAREAIKKLVAKQTDAPDVRLESRIDPDVLGGFKVSLPGHELDRTVRHQLTVLRTRYKKA